MSSSCFVSDRYFSRVALEFGGSHVEGVLKGWGSLCCLFLKKYCSLMDLAYLSKSLLISSRVGGLGVGAKLRPLDSTEAAESVSTNEERFVMCFLCCSKWICLKYVLLGSFLWSLLFFFIVVVPVVVV